MDPGEGVRGEEVKVGTEQNGEAGNHKAEEAGESLVAAELDLA